MVKRLYVKEDVYPADWKPSRDNIDRVFSALDQSDSKNPDFLKDSYGFSTYKVRYCDEKEDCISLQVSIDKNDYRFDDVFYIYPDTKKDTYKIETDELGERTVGKTTDVWDIISTCLRKQAKSGVRESVKVKESQQSSAAYYDFQDFLGRLTDYVDENNILVDLKGTKFAGDHHDTFEIIVYGAYSNEEITTIILEHSNRNDYNAWTATFDFDEEYDDNSATYLDDLYETVTGWLDTISSSGYAESVRRSSRNRATLRESDSAVMIKTTTSDGDYYLIKSATKQKSFWNPSISKVNSFAKKDSAMKKLYQVLEKLPENAFHDPDDIIDVEDESDLKKAKFAKFYLTDMSGKTIEDISDEVKKYLLADEKFLDGVFDDLADEDDMDESLMRESISGTLKNDTEYGFYLFKSYKKEYFFVSSAKAKTPKLVAKIIAYAYGVPESDVLDARSKNANDYKYIANKIEPAKITLKHSDKLGDYVDITGTKSQFSSSNGDGLDTQSELEIVYL